MKPEETRETPLHCPDKIVNHRAEKYIHGRGTDKSYLTRGVLKGFQRSWAPVLVLLLLTGDVGVCHTFAKFELSTVTRACNRSS